MGRLHSARPSVHPAGRPDLSGASRQKQRSFSPSRLLRTIINVSDYTCAPPKQRHQWPWPSESIAVKGSSYHRLTPPHPTPPSEIRRTFYYRLCLPPIFGSSMAHPPLFPLPHPTPGRATISLDHPSKNTARTALCLCEKLRRLPPRGMHDDERSNQTSISFIGKKEGMQTG